MTEETRITRELTPIFAGHLRRFRADLVGIIKGGEIVGVDVTQVFDTVARHALETPPPAIEDKLYQFKSQNPNLVVTYQGKPI